MSRDVKDRRIVAENGVEVRQMRFLSEQCGLCNYCLHVRRAKNRPVEAVVVP